MESIGRRRNRIREPVLLSMVTVHLWLLHPGFLVDENGHVGKGSPIMKRAQPVLMFSRRWMIGRVALVGVAVLGLLAAPGRLPAQDAGVSGIAPGPANARGLNGSINDPSGIGNAARMPALPPPKITPILPPSVSPSATYRPLQMQGALKIKRTRIATSGLRRSTTRAVSKKDRRLDRDTVSICRGC